MKKKNILLTALLAISVTQTTLPAESNQPCNENIATPKSTLTEKITIAAKLATTCAIIFGSHYILEYLTGYAHEHGHGIASGKNYTIEMIPTGNPIAPWSGVCYTDSKANRFFTVLGGPLAGMTCTYVQTIIFKTLDEYMHNESLRTSFCKGLKAPITFFDLTKRIEEIEIQSNNVSIKNLATLIVNGLLFLRVANLGEQSICGLTPFYGLLSKLNLIPEHTSDGEKLWKMILRRN